MDVWDGVQPEAPLENILEGVEALKASEASFIIAVGGGSAIDSAKVMWCLYEKPETDFHVIMAQSLWASGKRPFSPQFPQLRGPVRRQRRPQ